MARLSFSYRGWRRNDAREQRRHDHRGRRGPVSGYMLPAPKPRQAKSLGAAAVKPRIEPWFSSFDQRLVDRNLREQARKLSLVVIFERGGITRELELPVETEAQGIDLKNNTLPWLRAMLKEDVKLRGYLKASAT